MPFTFPPRMVAATRGVSGTLRKKQERGQGSCALTLPRPCARARHSPIDPHRSRMKTWPGQARSPDDPIFALLLALLRATTSVTSEDVGEPRWLREGLGRELARRIF